MIENVVKLDNKDINFILYKKLYHRWINFAFRIVLFLIAIIIIFLGRRELLDTKKPIAGGIIYIVLGIGIIIFNLFFYDLILRKNMRKILNYEKSKRIKIEKVNIKIIEENEEGKEVIKKIDFRDIKKFYLKKDRIYLYFLIDDNVEIIKLSDDGYKVGSKGEMLRILSKKHVKKR